MSSAFPTSSANAPGLGLLGCNAEFSESSSSPASPAFNRQPVGPSCPPIPDRASDSPEPPIALGERSSAAEESVSSPSQNGNGRLASARVLHRVAEVRVTQGLTERTVAKRLGVDVRTYRTLECPTTDLTLSELIAIQKALEVPMVELLEDQQSLSRPVEERAKLVKTMKTAVAIREAKSNPRIERLVRMLCEQLVDLMPELQEVSGWPQFGARRGQSSIGRVLSQPIDTSDIRVD